MWKIVAGKNLRGKRIISRRKCSWLKAEEYSIILIDLLYIYNHAIFVCDCFHWLWLLERFERKQKLEACCKGNANYRMPLQWRKRAEFSSLRQGIIWDPTLTTFPSMLKAFDHTHAHQSEIKVCWAKPYTLCMFSSYCGFPRTTTLSLFLPLFAPFARVFFAAWLRQSACCRC